jgi:ribosomal protein S11
MQYLWNYHFLNKNEFLNKAKSLKYNQENYSSNSKQNFDLIFEKCLESNNLPIWFEKNMSYNEYFSLFEQLHSEIRSSSNSDKFISLFQDTSLIKLFASFSYNNSIFTLVDQNNQVIKSFATGYFGFKGHKRSSSFAAEVLLSEVSHFLIKNEFTFIDVQVKGLGEG